MAPDHSPPDHVSVTLEEVHSLDNAANFLSTSAAVDAETRNECNRDVVRINASRNQTVFTDTSADRFRGL